MQFHAEYGLSAVPLRHSPWDHRDPWDFPCEAAASGSAIRADVKPAAEGVDCVSDDLNAVVARKYSAGGCQNSARQSPLALLGSLPGARLPGVQTFPACESKPAAEVARSILPAESKPLGGLFATLQRENHILSERQRRSGMNQLYAKMQSVLPNIGAQKTDKASLVTEMIKYIQSLQRRLRGTVAVQGSRGALGVVKSEPVVTSTTNSCSSVCNASIGGYPAGTSSSPAAGRAGDPFGQLAFHCNSNGLFITMVCEKKANLLPSIILVLECYDMEIVDAFVSTTDSVAFNCIHLKAPEIADPQTAEALKAALQKLMRSDFRISFPRLPIEAFGDPPRNGARALLLANLTNKVECFLSDIFHCLSVW